MAKNHVGVLLRSVVSHHSLDPSPNYLCQVSNPPLLGARLPSVPQGRGDKPTPLAFVVVSKFVGASSIVESEERGEPAGLK